MDNTMKRSATYLLGLLLLLAAGSCSVQKKCKAPKLDMPAEIVAGQSDTLTLSDRKWWEVYTDTTLCRLIGRTLDRNRNMLSAEARIRQLEELYRVSRAARLPSLGGLVLADNETNDYYGEAHKSDAEFSVKATLSWEADLWGSLRWAKRKGAAEYLASVEAARAVQMTLVAEVATAYFELVALDHELGVVRRTAETREESVRQAKLRFEGGLTSETAYQQAKVELASASALIPDLELRIAQKENQISVLAGDYPSRVARSKMDMNVRMPDSLPVGLPSTLLQRRPDVRQAEQNLKAAMAAAGMAYADRFPRLTISLTGGLENDAVKGLINSPFSYAVGNLTAPLFAFGSKRAKYRAALAAYDQARLAYEQKVLEVFREVNDAVTAYRNMRRTAELKFNLKEAARQYVVLAKLQYINGVIRYIDVLDAQRKFFDAQVVIPLPLADGIVLITVDGYITDDAEHERRQRVGPLRRNGIPDAQISIVYAFLGVPGIVQYVHSDRPAYRAVFVRQLSDCIFGAVKEQFDDLFVFHRRQHLLVRVSVYTLNKARHLLQNA